MTYVAGHVQEMLPSAVMLHINELSGHVMATLAQQHAAPREKWEQQLREAVTRVTALTADMEVAVKYFSVPAVAFGAHQPTPADAMRLLACFIGSWPAVATISVPAPALSAVQDGLRSVVRLVNENIMQQLWIAARGAVADARRANQPAAAAMSDLERLLLRFEPPADRFLHQIEEMTIQVCACQVCAH